MPELNDGFNFTHLIRQRVSIEYILIFGVICHGSYIGLKGNIRIKLLSGIVCLMLHGWVAAQQTAIIKGKILTEDGEPIEDATVSYQSESGVVTNKRGEYQLTVPASQEITIQVRHISYKTKNYKTTLEPGAVETFTFRMESILIDEYQVIEEKNRELPMININPSNIQLIATPGDPLMALLKTAGLGIASNNELSAGYSVRGGNFDENLIYVNDVEIYRPFLARSGQQEGLSFINPDMIQGISFSSGGFEAKYGDKMSSVLDITYRKPVRFGAAAMASLLGVNLHVEDAIFKNRFKYNIGFRYKSNNYILSSLDTRGEYKPDFIDFQSYLTYDATEKFEVNLMATYSDNNYRVIPENRTTTFGHVQQAKQLNVYFDGQEITRFQVASGALTFNFKPDRNSYHKLITSVYNTEESERFDILGQYFLGEIESDLADPNFGEVINTVGVGSFLNHARNRLNATVATVETKSRIYRESKKPGSRNSMNMNWGIRYQREWINDKLDEWNLLDSSGYLLPYYGPGDNGPIALQDVRKSTIELSSNRFMAYYQHGFTWWVDSAKITLNAGVRTQYWDLNREWLFSPRMQFSWEPNWKADILFRVSGGIYYQAPFYRELRDLNGVVNTNVKAQRSIHAVVGMDYNFRIWKRPFKFVTEVYYKHLDNLNPYELDNVRIRYYATNNARGYAAGVDFKLGGEFIEGLESWLTMSIMQTQEDIIGDFYVNNSGDTVFPGYIPRPTDQRFTMGLFFQDHIPGFKPIRVHLNLLFGSQLPFGPPNDNRYADTLRAPFYRRVDIGFSYVVLQPDRKFKKPKSFMHHINSFWLSFEVFNLLDINNTVSYTWIRDITNRQYAVPNYLTPRLFNLKLVVKI